ncbi:hypothetical protein [Rhodococcus sp. NPDC003383]
MVVVLGTAPRRLKLTFEFCVAEGISKNIQDRHLERAVDKIETSVRTMAAEAFPWADRLEVTREWNYAWWSDTDYASETYGLPKNDFNSPK